MPCFLQGSCPFVKSSLSIIQEMTILFYLPLPYGPRNFYVSPLWLFWYFIWYKSKRKQVRSHFSLILTCFVLFLWGFIWRTRTRIILVRLNPHIKLEIHRSTDKSKLFFSLSKSLISSNTINTWANLGCYLKMTFNICSM